MSDEEDVFDKLIDPTEEADMSKINASQFYNQSMNTPCRN
jgi:hypothetical protein